MILMIRTMIVVKVSHIATEIDCIRMASFDRSRRRNIFLFFQPTQNLKIT